MLDAKKKKKKKEKANSQYFTWHNNIHGDGNRMGKAILTNSKRDKVVQREVYARIVLEKGIGKLVWDFQFNLQKSATRRRLDLVLKNKEKEIWFMI